MNSEERIPWTNVYGLARTILAVGTVLPLAFTHSDVLFRPVHDTALAAVSGHFMLAKYNFFSVFGEANFELARWSAVAALLAVSSGYRPRLTGILHWWISLSFSIMCIPAVGGDQMTSVLTGLLLPVTLTDARRWHWDAPPAIESIRVLIASRIALSSLAIIRVQVATAYLWAGVSKLSEPEWANGTAVYYWFTHPVVGLPERYAMILTPFLANQWIVALLTWSPILLEIVLFLSLAMSPSRRRWLFPIALLFHFGNLIVFGLVSFFFAMAGALVLLLLPLLRPLHLAEWRLGEYLIKRAIPLQS